MSDVSFMLSEADKGLMSKIASEQNKLNFNKEKPEVMGKDDFLKLLVVQLQNQDPTNPMEDKEFISQTSQFSSLEQMQNMVKGFEKLAASMKSNEALGYLGRTVEAKEGDRMIVGKVEEVKGKDVPLLLVNGRYYDVSQIEKVRE